METVRVIGVLAVLSLLQFFISICISAFACKATCCSEPMVPVVTIAHPAHINPQTVQIMIGLITLLFGIVLGSDFSFVLASVVTGNLYWASIVYIIAGSLSVAAETKLHPCLVRGSLGMNVVSAVFSAVGMGVLITDFFLYYDCYSNEVCYRFQARSKAISGVLLVFAVLQFIISISISVFACKATCCSETMVPFVTYANHTVTGNPQNVVYIPQAQVNMNNPVQQNIPVQQNNPVQQNIYDWPGR